jgi:polyisoprenyl-phosphate glycosyltransferase
MTQKLPPHNTRPTLSLVIPLYNEKKALPQLFSRVNAVLQHEAIDHEIILVDDGSKDGSWEVLSTLSKDNSHIKIIRFSRNFGKEAATTAGLAHASGDATILLDADLQDPPELIPDMLKAWQDQQADIVLMKRRSRQGEGWVKRLSAHLFYRLLSAISRTNIPKDTGDFRLMSRRALDALNQLPERNRYMKGLFAWVGFPAVVLEYDREPRSAGITQWGWLGLLGLALEGITSFSIAPLRAMAALGLVTALIGLLFSIWIVLKTLVMGIDVQGYASLMAAMTFFSGIQLLSIGMVGEYVGKTYFEVKQRPLYIIQDIISHTAATDKESLHDRTP